ncbi:hypothetical protein C2E19_08805 [Pseudomonas sp. DTU12.3]|nr:hypothetical protein C2E19_08805 [Pseudomonas sp. DTU12.3]
MKGCTVLGAPGAQWLDALITQSTEIYRLGRKPTLVVFLFVAQRPDIKLAIRLAVKHEILDRGTINLVLKLVLRDFMGENFMADPA